MYAPDSSNQLAIALSMNGLDDFEETKFMIEQFTQNFYKECRCNSECFLKVHKDYVSMDSDKKSVWGFIEEYEDRLRRQT